LVAKQLLATGLRDVVIRRGMLRDADGTPLIHDHCWVEVAREAEAPLVLDLTADQAGRSIPPVLVSDHSMLARLHHLLYEPTHQYDARSIGGVGAATRSRCEELFNSFCRTAPS
jgi:hypothetical protein